MKKTTVIIIYFLSFYIILQFVWWGYHLFQLNEQVLASGEELNKKYMMIIGEGIVFFSILLFGIVKLMKSVKKDLALNNQKKNFLLSVTHELKSPLASIKLNLQTLNKRSLEKETQKKIIEKSEMEIVRLENIVNNILAVTRLENSQRIFEKLEFSMSDLVRKQVEFYKINQGANHFFIEQIEQNISFQGDPALFELMISNLIENAIKYSDVNTEITVGLKKHNNKIELSVQDKGLGIAKEDQDKIFDKFFRSGNEEVRQAKGTGLGLFLVKSLVSEYKGNIKVQTQENEGTKFIITI